MSRSGNGMGDANLDLLISQDEELAEQLDRQRFAAEEQERVAEVADVIAQGAADGPADGKDWHAAFLPPAPVGHRWRH